MNVKNNFYKIKNIILIYFQIKIILKNNINHTSKIYFIKALANHDPRYARKNASLIVF